MCSPPLISSRQLHVYDNHGFVCIFCSILLSRLGYILFSRVHRDMLNFYLFIYTVMPLFFLPYIAGPSAGDVLNISHWQFIVYYLQILHFSPFNIGPVFLVVCSEVFDKPCWTVGAVNSQPGTCVKRKNNCSAYEGSNYFYGNRSRYFHRFSGLLSTKD